MKLAIIIPTYNERKNIKKLVEQILGLNLKAQIVIVDDNSPDGTGEITDILAKKYPEIKVIHRKEKKGLGAAYVEGLRYAFRQGVEKAITMDGDFSHNPRSLLRLLKESEKYDVVVGSRYVTDGKIVRWELWRKLLSWGGINMSRALLGLSIKDCTSGFRCYGRKFLELGYFNEASSQGYAFLVEMIFQAQNQGFSIFEFPIIFKGREEGESKFNLREMGRFAQNILGLFFQRLLKKTEIREDILSPEFQKKNKDYYRYIEDYDWTEVTDNLRGLETFFHRKRAKEIQKLIEQFGRGKRYLDAGCGTGLILRNLPGQPTGLDINPRNIKKAEKYAPLAQLVEGDVEDMPFLDSSFSTVICSEVLEHLPDPRKSLSEMKRVLESGGVVIGSVPQNSLFWKLRFLSRTCPRTEPFHKEFKLRELRGLLSPYFEIMKLSSATWGMNIMFVCRKTK